MTKKIVCPVTSALTKCDHVFCLQVPKRLLLILNSFFAILLIAVVLYLAISVFFIINFQSMTGLMDYIVVISLLLPLIIFGLLIIFVFQRIVSISKIPTQNNILSFTPDLVKEIRILKKVRNFITFYNFSLVLQLKDDEVDVPLKIDPSFSKEEAENIAIELVEFLGGNIPIKWEVFSYSKLIQLAFQHNKKFFKKG